MKNLEMHCHSNRSDGRNTPEQVIQRAQELDLDFLSLTDHDIISPQGFQKDLRSMGIQSCDSVEVSARNYEHKKSLHLVSYAKKFQTSFHEALDTSMKGKIEMKRGQLQKMISMGYNGDQEDFGLYINSMNREAETANKYDMSLYLMSNIENQKKACESLDLPLDTPDLGLQFYLHVLKRGGKLYDTYSYEVDDYELSVQKTVEEVVQKAGGLVSVAHPNITFGRRLKEREAIEEFKHVLPDYVQKGVRGIEVNAVATPAWLKSIMEARQKYDMILTFGSDCHNIGTTDSKHGDLGDMNQYLLGADYLREVSGDTQVIDQNFGRFKEQIGIA